MNRITLSIIFIACLSLSSLISANEKIPDDVRYMLEDMYGENKNEWPSPRYKADLNKDGFSDWVAVKKSCKLKNSCAAEIFICKPDKKGMCSEYCYSEVKSMKNIEETIKHLKCESTC